MLRMKQNKPPSPMSVKGFQEIINKTGLKPGEVAERLGVHRATVYRWIAGTVNIDAASAALIRAVFKTK